jgi:hypothetical protein
MPRLTTEQNKNYDEYTENAIIDSDSFYHEYDQGKAWIVGTNKDGTLKYEYPPEPIEMFFSIFENEFNWEIKKYGEFRALVDYLMGEPSAIHLPSYHHNQIELAKSFGSIPQNATEKEEQKIIDNFYKFFAMRLIKIRNRVAN